MISDLSESHRRLTGIFSKDEIESIEPITGDQLDRFERDGFVIGVPLLGATQIDQLRSELEMLMAPGQAENRLFYEYHSNESDDPQKRLFHALGAWRVSKAFHDLVFFQRLITAAERLLKGPVRLWHDQVFVKPAGDGAVVAWHQDYSYWTRTVPMAHLTCWIGLDDADEENGCVHYVPGSHRWPLLPREHLANDMNAVFSYLDAEQKKSFNPVASVLKAGIASFHHPMTLHGSFENRSERPRRGVVINFICDGVRSNTNEELLSGVPIVPKGQKLEGQFFPLLSQ